MERPSYSSIAIVTIAVLSGAALSTANPESSQAQPGNWTPQQVSPRTGIDPELVALTEALPMLDDKARRGLALQVALDRAGFSPGEIDAAPGPNTDRAAAAFAAANGNIDSHDAYTNPIAPYTISAGDVAGPFIEVVPDDMMQKASLASMAYTSVVELLAERFHASPKLLQRLNPEAAFTEGETILVPNVDPFMSPRPTSEMAESGTRAGNRSPDAAKAPRSDAAPHNDPARASHPPRQRTAQKGLTVTVTDRTKTLEVRNASGQIIFHAPVTVGSERDPLPVGEWTVTGVSRNPVFNYNPELFWDADPAHAKAKVSAGPNNPVGVVWIDLNKEHYGIHGTPEPSRVGYTESHGCIRLTNWDAMRLADLVSPGTKVILR